jgi:hypothetical protein
MQSSRHNPDATYNGPSEPPVAFASSTEIMDLGRERFDKDVAAANDRDTSLYYAPGTVNVHEGRAPKGMESKVWAWKTLQFTDEDKNRKEEMKGDLHGGQLHRQNRAARAPEESQRFGGDGRGRPARGGKKPIVQDREDEGLVAGRKPDHDAPPLAKGFAEELDKSFFWDEPIV